MIMWGILCGAVLGWLWPSSGYGDFGIFLGGGLGLLAGLGLQHAVRSEMRKSNEKLRLQMLELLKSRGDSTTVPDSTPAGKPALASAPDTPVASAAPAATAARPATPDIPPATQPAAPPAPARVLPLAEPNAIELAFAAAKNWLLGGNTIVRIGLVILFIGLSFLSSYAAAAA